jgi:hypothetical protein
MKGIIQQLLLVALLSTALFAQGTGGSGVNYYFPSMQIPPPAAVSDQVKFTYLQNQTLLAMNSYLKTWSGGDSEACTGGASYSWSALTTPPPAGAADSQKFAYLNTQLLIASCGYAAALASSVEESFNEGNQMKSKILAAALLLSTGLVYAQTPPLCNPPATTPASTCGTGTGYTFQSLITPPAANASDATKFQYVQTQLMLQMTFSLYVISTAYSGYQGSAFDGGVTRPGLHRASHSRARIPKRQQRLADVRLTLSSPAGAPSSIPVEENRGLLYAAARYLR